MSWDPSKHPRDRKGRFREKRATTVAKGVVAAAPVAVTIATSVKPIAMGSAVMATNPVIGVGVLSASAFGLARSTSRARQIYGGEYARKRGGEAARERFLQNNARVDKYLGIGRAISGTAAFAGVAYDFTGGRKYVANRAAANRAAASNLQGRKQLGRTAMSPAKRNVKGVYNITTAGRKLRR